MNQTTSAFGRLPAARPGAMLPIYHVRRAHEFRRSFLLAAPVF